MRGLYISFDGIDGAGSTTHTKLLSSWLKFKGLKVFETKEPTMGKIGSLIRAYLHEAPKHPAIDALLFAADRVEHSITIKKLLEEGFIVVSDRSLISSLAYQQAQGLELKWILEVNRYSLKPDMPIILDIDPTLSLSRKRTPRERFENPEFLKLVRKILLDMALNNGWIIVDASKPLETIASDIRNLVVIELKRRGIRVE
ncbi:MAG: dTMP kinase [Candidatus Nezhaarchaeota archaeon]|nr:dTMP kinase [Candidatus Nezhaarchaeota archaeon]MCX8141721.1 dTMP kinase [Candidatus Nezhaarchaeota archaeon]MDW8049988.1 dTMP kinase [Nitrososphaerota archaeon]